MSDDIFLCGPCSTPGGEEKNKTPRAESKACEYCGALCTNVHPPWGQERPPGSLPFGAYIVRNTAPAPRALSRAEAEARVLPLFEALNDLDLSQVPTEELPALQPVSNESWDEPSLGSRILAKYRRPAEEW